MSSIKNSLEELEIPSNLSLILATVWIATKVYPSKTRGPTIFGQYADSEKAYLEHNDLLEAILIRVSSTPVTRALLESDRNVHGDLNRVLDFFFYLTNEEYLFRLNANKLKAIWFVDSLNSFGRLEYDILNERNHFHRSGFFSIIYTGREQNRLDIIRTIFHRLLDIYVVNVNVLLGIGSTVHIYTYFPFSETTCHCFEPHFHGIFGPTTNYQYSSTELFPRKLRNMWGCKVNVTTWTELPFVDIEYNETTGQLLKLGGIEGSLLLLLSERMNFTITIVEATAKSAGSATEPGLIKMLIDGLTNISMSCLIYDKTRKELTQPAYSYLQVPLSLAIPLGKMMTPLERLIRPFRCIVWSCLSASVLLGILIIFALKAFCNKMIQEFVLGHGNRIPFTNLWRSFYGVSMTGALPRRNFARYILAIWILYAMVLRSAYLAQLFLILQDSRARSALNSVRETLQQNFTFYAYPNAVPILQDIAKYPINVKLLDSDENLVLDLFKHISEDENAKIAISILRPVIRAYNQEQTDLNHRINILPENLFHAPLTFYMRKHSYLTFEVNGLLLKIVAAGLVDRFERLFWNERSYITKDAKTSDSIPLNLLVGLFIVHFFLLLLCTFVFLLELWSKHSPLAKVVIDFFNC